MTDIEKLKELEAKATPGPWTRQTLEPQTLGYEWIDAPGYTHVAVCRDLTKFDQTNRLHLRPELDEITANTEFIVAARNTLPALLASLASKEGEIAELRARLDRSRDEYHRKVDHDLTQARAERDEWKDACRRAGVCMSCATSNRDPMGCTDCLNTGWNGGEPIEAQEASARAEAAESRLTTALAALGEAREALEPFACSDGCRCDQLQLPADQRSGCLHRKARATLAKLNALEGNEDD